MNSRKMMIGAAAIFGLSLSLQQANADVICDACEYLGEATWLGLYDPENFDSATFFQDIETGDSASYWVFDLASEGNVFISAELTETSPPVEGDLFEAFLISANLVQCDIGAPPQPCGYFEFGEYVYQASPSLYWEIDVRNLAAGSYVLFIEDECVLSCSIAYTGELTVWTDRVPIPAPTSLSLLGLGMLGLAGTARRSRR